MVAVGASLQQLPVARGAHSGQQAVLRYIVAAHGEDLNAIVHKAELGAAVIVLIPLGADCQRPQTDFLGHGIHGFTTADQLCFRLIQALLTVAPRPPESGIPHRHSTLAPGQFYPLPVNGEINITAAPMSGGHRDVQFRLPFAVVLQNGDILDLVPIISLQLHLPKDAHILQLHRDRYLPI